MLSRRRQRSEMGLFSKSTSASLLLTLILVTSSDCFVGVHNHHAQRQPRLATNEIGMFMIKETDKFGSIDEYDDDDNGVVEQQQLDWQTRGSKQY